MFNNILKNDRARFDVGEDYEIGDTVADEWQQCIDDVVVGTTVAWKRVLLILSQLLY